MCLFPWQQIFDIHPVLGKHLVPGVTNIGNKNVETNKDEHKGRQQQTGAELYKAQRKLKRLTKPA